MFLFVYGSLADRVSAAGTLGRDLPSDNGLFRATLIGWERGWTVATGRHSHPERQLLMADGAEFLGVMAVLGISPVPGRACSGAVLRVTEQDLDRLDARERNYRRHGVTGSVTWAEKPAQAQVFAYVPTPGALSLLEQNAERHQAVIDTGYAELAESGFRSLGDGELERFHATTAPSDLERRPIRPVWHHRETD